MIRHGWCNTDAHYRKNEWPRGIIQLIPKERNDNPPARSRDCGVGTGWLLVGLAIVVIAVYSLYRL